MHEHSNSTFITLLNGCCVVKLNSGSRSFLDDMYGLLQTYSAALVEPYWSFCCHRIKVLENSLGKQVQQSLTSLIQILVRLMDINKGYARKTTSDFFWLFDLLMRYRCYLPIQQLSIFVYRVYQLNDY